jgi:hypothetical protein
VPAQGNRSSLCAASNIIARVDGLTQRVVLLVNRGRLARLRNRRDQIAQQVEVEVVVAAQRADVGDLHAGGELLERLEGLSAAARVAEAGFVLQQVTVRDALQIAAAPLKPPAERLIRSLLIDGMTCTPRPPGGGRAYPCL